METQSTSTQNSTTKKAHSEEQTETGKFFSPATDIIETADSLIVTMDLPGVQKDNLSVKVEKEVLEVKGRLDTEVYKGLEPAYTEYHVGHFLRKFGISQTVDASRIEAQLKDGVLRLVLPKREEEKTRTIPVK